MADAGSTLADPPPLEMIYYQPSQDLDSEDKKSLETSKPKVKKVTAASQAFPNKNMTRPSGSGGNSRQKKSWEMYDEHPEVGFYANWNANAMSKIKLYASRITSSGEFELIENENHEASIATDMIANGRVGQSSMLKKFGQLLSVAGEGWIIVSPDESFAITGNDLIWETISRSELSFQGSFIRTKMHDGKTIEIDTKGKIDSFESGFAIRVFTEHPDKRGEPDSPIMRSLPLLEELSLLNSAIAAIAQSRITGRGILFVPDGISLPQGSEEQGDSDDILETLLEASEIAIKEPESAAAAVPVMVQVPADMIAAIQHVTFESDFDEIAIKLREEIIGRFATGIDTPAEILLGTRDQSHWQAWINQTEAIRMSIEPKVQEICEALTNEWLRPVLIQLGVEDPGSYAVWYDTSALKQNSNRPQAALEAWDRGLISDRATRRELGFDESDAPGAEDRRNVIRGETIERDDQIRLPTDENENARELPSGERVERRVEDEGQA